MYNTDIVAASFFSEFEKIALIPMAQGKKGLNFLQQAGTDFLGQAKANKRVVHPGVVAEKANMAPAAGGADAFIAGDMGRVYSTHGAGQGFGSGATADAMNAQIRQMNEAQAFDSSTRMGLQHTDAQGQVHFSDAGSAQQYLADGTPFKPTDAQAQYLRGLGEGQTANLIAYKPRSIVTQESMAAMSPEQLNAHRWAQAQGAAGRTLMAAGNNPGTTAALAGAGALGAGYVVS